jgi:hypothetical protein
MEKLDLAELMAMQADVQLIEKDFNVDNIRQEDFQQAMAFGDTKFYLFADNHFRLDVSRDGFVTFETTFGKQLICTQWLARATAFLAFTNKWNNYFSDKQDRLDRLEDAKAELEENEKTESIFGFANVFKKEAN